MNAPKITVDENGVINVPWPGGGGVKVALTPEQIVAFNSGDPSKVGSIQIDVDKQVAVVK